MSEIQTEYVGVSNGSMYPQYRWWMQPEHEMHRHIWQVVNNIEGKQGNIRLAQMRYVAAYSNCEIFGLSSKFFSRSYLLPILNGRISLNVIKSCVDSAAAKIAKNRVRPFFLTEEGNWGQQTKAKKLTKFMEGVFEEANAYEKAPAAFVDAAVTGLGALHPYYDRNSKSWRIDRIFPEELTFDESDAIYGEPRQIHRLKYISREILVEMYPKYSEEIKSAQPYIRSDVVDKNIANQVAVRESWHLPCAKNSGDGKHVISIENATLFAEDYDKDYFPFVFFRWVPRIYGFNGSGLAEELIGIQNEVNSVARNIQRAVHFVGVPRVWVENGSMVDLNLINNEVASIGKYSGSPPIFQVNPSMAPDVYAYFENLFQKAYQITGISMLSATSTKPAGVNAAVAMREYQDIESMRFSLVEQRYEKSFLDLSKIIIDQACDLAKEGEDVFVKTASKKSFIQTIKWKEVNIPEDKYIMRTFPTSLLPSQPQGKLSMIQELTQAGFLSPEEAKSLLDFPDLEAVMALDNAPRDIIMMIIEGILDEGKYESPSPLMNLKMGSILAQYSYLKAKQQNAPEDRLEDLRRFANECEALMAPPPAPMDAPGLPPGVAPSSSPGVSAPLAKSEPMNRNELIPNIPQGVMPQ